MLRTVVGLLALWASVQAAPTQRSTSSPRVNVKNGTYVGVSNINYNQDFFLGMPYAQQPVGNLRFTVPQSLNESWYGERDAKAYSDICVGYGVSHTSLVDLVGAIADDATDRLDMVSHVRSMSHAQCHPRLLCR